jgi:hypothetical protein
MVQIGTQPYVAWLTSPCPADPEIRCRGEPRNSKGRPSVHPRINRNSRLSEERARTVASSVSDPPRQGIGSARVVWLRMNTTPGGMWSSTAQPAGVISMQRPSARARSTYTRAPAGALVGGKSADSGGPRHRGLP